MRVVSGTVVETRYAKDDAANKLVQTGVVTGTAGATIYIDDSIGLHKVTNPISDGPAMTLHLYSPPFNKCKIWLDGEAAADKVSASHQLLRCGTTAPIPMPTSPRSHPPLQFLTPTVTYHSEYGQLVTYEADSALCRG